MLQFPVEVRPDNIIFDNNSNTPENRRFRFKFKGDYLMACAVRIFDYETGELACDDQIFHNYNQATMSFHTMAYNNDFLQDDNVFNNGKTTNGRKYIMQLLLCAGTPVQAGWDSSTFVCRGRIAAPYIADLNVIQVEKDIPDIYRWDLSTSGIREPLKITTIDNIEWKLTNMMIRINGMDKQIQSYNANTGEIRMLGSYDEAFSEGTPYEIWCNYIISEQYYFRVDNDPQILNPDVYWLGDCFSFSANYRQNHDIPMKYYTITLQYKDKYNKYHDLYKTERIYSQRIQSYFTDDYNEGAVTGGNYSTHKYRFIVDYVVEGGLAYQYISEDYTQPTRVDTDIIDDIAVNHSSNVENFVMVTWHCPNGADLAFRVYRMDYQEGLGNNPKKTLVGDTDNIVGFVDCTIPNKGDFRYMVVPYEPNRVISTDIYNAVLTDEFTNDFDGYTVTAITDTGWDADGKPLFLRGDTFKFVADVETGTITQNLDKTLHVGYGEYSSLTSTKTEYLSGSLSGLLGTVQCPDNKYVDTIDRVKKWRKFISQDCQFILRTRKGDVWVVNVVDNPTTEYTNDMVDNPTKFSFSWAECCNIDEILITDTSDVTKYPANAHRRGE